MTERLRFGLVGCGVIGPVHAEALSRLPDAVHVSVADLIPESAQTLAARYGATPYTDLSTMLEREGLDVVIICTPGACLSKLSWASTNRPAHTGR